MPVTGACGDDDYRRTIASISVDDRQRTDHLHRAVRFEQQPTPPPAPASEEPSVPTINPYLVFDGTCEEAFEAYRSIFGGEFFAVTRFSEGPADTLSDPSDAGLIMHISLPLGEGQALMGSDRPPRMGPGTLGDSMAVYVSVGSSDEGQRVFDGLAAGGQVSMPFERQFWGDDYGMCVDRFGVHWMVGHTPTR
jgi:PhnB protein